MFLKVVFSDSYPITQAAPESKKAIQKEKTVDNAAALVVHRPQRADGDARRAYKFHLDRHCR